MYSNNDHASSYVSHVDPVFKDYIGYLANYDCYQQDLPVIDYGDKVAMSVDVSGNSLTLIWTVTINGITEVIDKHNEQYVLEDHNKVIMDCRYSKHLLLGQNEWSWYMYMYWTKCLLICIKMLMFYLKLH